MSGSEALGSNVAATVGEPLRALQDRLFSPTGRGNFELAERFSVGAAAARAGLPMPDFESTDPVGVGQLPGGPGDLPPAA